MIIPMIFALTMSQAARGYAAHYCGDNVAKSMGRLTFDPIKHIDVLGTLVIPIILYSFSSFFFGWAKPMPFDYSRCKNPRQAERIIALAGPLANFVWLIIWALLSNIALFLPSDMQVNFFKMCNYGMSFNAFFMIFMLLPLPGFDGGSIINSFLPYNYSRKFMSIAPYSFYIVLLLIILNVITVVIYPIYQLLMRFGTLFMFALT